MRSKPRRVTFPALRFVKLSHNANVTRHRLKHFLLLAMRMSAIAILAVALARPQCQQSRATSLGGREPASAVAVIDTSGSMAYRVGNESRLALGKRLAGSILGDLPGRSEAAAVWPGRPGPDVPLSTDTGLAVRQVQELSDRPAAGDQAAPTFRTGQRAWMVQLLQRAYATLERAANPRRVIYVINDRTRDSWDGLTEGLFAKHRDVSVVLLDVGANENQDFQITEARWAAQVLSPRRGGVLTATVAAGELTGTRTVKLEMDGATLGNEQIDLPQKRGSASVRFTLPPLPTGLHTGQVRIVNADEIPENNVRTVALEVGPLPQVIVVESPATGPGVGLSVADHVEAVLAPPHRVRAGENLTDLFRVPGADFLIKPDAGAARLERAQAVVLADVALLGSEQWTALKNYVASGGTLIVVLGPTADPRAWGDPAARAVLPVAGLGQRVRARGDGAPAALPDFAVNPVLADYRRSDQAPQLDRELVHQYYRPADGPLPPNTAVLIELAGDRPDPLLLERRLGAGRCLMLMTSPQPAWSEWSQLSATWPGLLYSMVTVYGRATQRVYHFQMDAAAGFVAPSAFRGGSAVFELPDGRGRATSLVPPKTGSLTLPTDHLGIYRGELQAPGADKLELAWAVNFDPAEYAMDKIDPNELARFFPPGRFAVVSDPGQLRAAAVEAQGGEQEIGALVALALLILLIGESFFANRFYRSPAAAGPAPVARVIDDSTDAGGAA